jgi:hypothetical protein
VAGFDQKPVPACELRDSDGVELAGPSWSPDSAALAWWTAAGIYTSPVGPNCEGFVEKLAIPGGREPDWGPAEPGDAPVVQPDQPQQGGQAPAPKILKVKARKRRVTVTVNCDCLAKVVAHKGKRVVGRASGRGKIVVRVRARGKVKLTVTANGTKLVRTVKVR